MSENHRVDQIRQRLSAEGLGALVVTKIANVVYMTGFDGVFDGEEAHAAVITSEGLRLYTDSRYAEAARTAADGTMWQVVVPKDNLYSTVCSELASQGIASLALESSVPYGRFRFISEQFSGNVTAVEQWVEDIRQVKTAEEIARIEAAQRLTDVAFDHILTFIRQGVTEMDIALELEFFMRSNGSEGVAFPPIVASGPNSAHPHATVTRREILAGEFVKLDFGAKLGGYCADMTRTVVAGVASDRHREVYSVVRAANEAGIAAARAGLPGVDIDAAARAVIEQAGYGENFGHGLGHGVGLEVHELPVVGPRGAKSVPEQSVFTVEPGVYLPGFGGVRIEDLVVAEAGGCRVLTASTKELLEL